MLHALDVASPDDVHDRHAGARALGARSASGAITDIVCFEPAAGERVATSTSTPSTT